MAIQMPNIPENDATQYLSQQSMRGADVSLYLFPPRIIPDQVRRPLMYRFGGEFTGQVQENLKNKLSRGGGVSMPQTMLTGVPTANMAILPSAEGIPVDVDIFRSRWTFLLSIDLASDPTSPMPSRMNSRLIASGYCTDEPMGTGYGGATPPIRQDCFFVITHHTVVGTHTVMDAYGSKPIVQTTTDVDHVNAADVLMTAPTNYGSMYPLLPEKVQQGCIVSEYGTVESITGIDSRLDYKDPTYTQASELAVPHQQLQRIVSGLYQGLLVSDPSMVDTCNMDLHTTGMDIKTAAFSQELGIRVPYLNNIGLDTNQPFSFGQLVAKYPDIRITSIRYNQIAPTWDSCPQEAASARNIMSSMISNIMPSLLAKLGLCEVAFRYSSYESDGVSIYNRGLDMPEIVAGLVQMSTETLKLRYDQLITELKNFVFPTVEMSNGPFDLLIHCSIGGACLVNLIYADDRLCNQAGYFEVANALGGLNTPLVGTCDVFTENAQQLASIATNIFNDNRGFSTVPPPAIIDETY